jgi:hypothetical protein
MLQAGRYIYIFFLFPSKTNEVLWCTLRCPVPVRKFDAVLIQDSLVCKEASVLSRTKNSKLPPSHDGFVGHVVPSMVLEQKCPRKAVSRSQLGCGVLQTGRGKASDCQLPSVCLDTAVPSRHPTIRLSVCRSTCLPALLPVILPFAFVGCVCLAIMHWASITRCSLLLLVSVDKFGNAKATKLIYHMPIRKVFGLSL